MGSRHPAGTPGSVRIHLARRPVSFRTRGMDAAHASRRDARVRQPGSHPHHAGHAAAEAQRALVDARSAGAQRRALGLELQGECGGRCASPARRFVLRRAGARHGTAAYAGGRRAVRAGRAGSRQLRQLRGSARAADPVGATQAARRRQAIAAHGPARHRGRRPLGAAQASARGRCAGAQLERRRSGDGRACRVDAASSLRRRVLAAVAA